MIFLFDLDPMACGYLGMSIPCISIGQILSLIVNVLPVLSIIIGFACLLTGIHKESWGDVIIQPKLIYLGIFLILLPFIIGIILWLVQL